MIHIYIKVLILILTVQSHAGLADTNWKTRLAAVQSFQAALPGAESTGSQLLYRVLARKPGLRDTNVQVLRARLEACKYITDNYPVST